MSVAIGGLKKVGSSATSAAVVAALVGQDVVARSFTATQVSGSDAFKMLNGARVNFSTADVSAYIARSAANELTTPAAVIAASLSSAAGINLLNPTAFGFAMNGIGVIYQNGSGGPIIIRGVTADGSGVKAIQIGSVSTLSDATARIVSFCNDAAMTEKSYIDSAGQYVGTSFLDDSANTGNRTVDKVRGKSAFAGAATAITITNSFCASTSHVTASLQTNDATAQIKSVVPGAGSFTINIVAATGTTVVSWKVEN